MTTTAHTISLPDCQKPPSALAAQAVVGLRVRGTTTEFPLDSRATWWMLGTSPSSEICIMDDPYVSSVHAVLSREDGNLILTDRSTKNGTFVNGVRCTTAHVRDGAHIQVGATHLVAFSAESRSLLHPVERLIGESERFAMARERALDAARRSGTVLLIGEPGTGKRTFAQAIHQASPRSTELFTDIDAAVLDASAVCAALNAQPSAAHAGTIYLHHIDKLTKQGELAVLKLACRLQEATSEPARLVLSATSTPASWVDAVGPLCSVEIPPLRERPEDLPPLLQMMVRELSYGQSIELPPVETAALAGLDWPENVAELRRVVRQMVATTTGQITVATVWGTPGEMHEAFQRAIERALASTSSRRAAAEVLGVSWTTFRRWAERFSL